MLEAYAMTEASHQMTSNLFDKEHGRLVGSVGKPTGNLELFILDQEGNRAEKNVPGEICIRGPSVMKGYLNNQDANQKAFTRDGFLRTGDQGLQTSEGFIRITGRIKELINKVRQGLLIGTIWYPAFCYSAFFKCMQDTV